MKLLGTILSATALGLVMVAALPVATGELHLQLAGSFNQADIEGSDCSSGATGKNIAVSTMAIAPNVCTQEASTKSNVTVRTELNPQNGVEARQAFTVVASVLQANGDPAVLADNGPAVHKLANDVTEADQASWQPHPDPIKNDGYATGRPVEPEPTKKPKPKPTLTSKPIKKPLPIPKPIKHPHPTSGPIKIPKSTLKPVQTPTAKPAETSTPLPDLLSTSGPAEVGLVDETKLEGSGSVRVTKDGAVVENLDIRGTLIIAAKDVTVRNVRIRTNSARSGIYVEAGAHGALIEHVEVQTGVRGRAAASGIGSDQDMTYHEPGDKVTVRNVWIHGSGVSIDLAAGCLCRGNRLTPSLDSGAASRVPAARAPGGDF